MRKAERRRLGEAQTEGETAEESIGRSGGSGFGTMRNGGEAPSVRAFARAPETQASSTQKRSGRQGQQDG